MSSVNVCTFSGIGSLPVFAADRLRFFPAFGIEVNVEVTKNSRSLMNGLLGGTYDVVHAAPDNMIAWSDRTGEDLRAWIGGSAGPLALAARLGLSNVPDLRGQIIAVDAVTSGFVGVLREIMRWHGIGDDEYELREIGATPLRFEAVVAGDADATLLSIPLSLRAEARGLTIVATHETVLTRYQSFAGFSRGDWLDAEPDTADAYLRALVATLTWLYDPTNHDAVMALAEECFDLSSEEAVRATSIILDPATGWPPSGLIDVEAVATVCRLRAETSGPPLYDAPHYVDLRPYTRVVGSGLQNG